MIVLQRVHTHLPIIYGSIAWHISSLLNAYQVRQTPTHFHTSLRIQTTRVYIHHHVDRQKWQRERKQRAKRFKWYDAYPQELTAKRIFNLIILSLIHNSSTNAVQSVDMSIPKNECICSIYILVQYVCRACNVPGKTMIFFPIYFDSVFHWNLWAFNFTTSIHSSATM